MDSDTNFKLDKEILKYLAVHSSPFTSAIALAILDEMTGGKVTEFKKQLENAPSKGLERVQIPQGAKVKGGVRDG